MMDSNSDIFLKEYLPLISQVRRVIIESGV
jgi:hypothetical protein